MKADKYIGYYSEYSYSICVLDKDGNVAEEVYSAGNHSLDSQQYLPIDHEYACSLEQMEEFCNDTGKEIAYERDGIFLGVEYDESRAEEIKEIHKDMKRYIEHFELHTQPS